VEDADETITPRADTEEDGPEDAEVEGDGVGAEAEEPARQRKAPSAWADPTVRSKTAFVSCVLELQGRRTTATTAASSSIDMEEEEEEEEVAGIDDGGGGRGSGDVFDHSSIYRHDSALDAAFLLDDEAAGDGDAPASPAPAAPSSSSASAAAGRAIPPPRPNLNPYAHAHAHAGHLLSFASPARPPYAGSATGAARRAPLASPVPAVVSRAGAGAGAGEGVSKRSPLVAHAREVQIARLMQVRVDGRWHEEGFVC